MRTWHAAAVCTDTCSSISRGNDALLQLVTHSASTHHPAEPQEQLGGYSAADSQLQHPGWAVRSGLCCLSLVLPALMNTPALPTQRTINYNQGIAMRDTCSGGDIAQPRPSVLPVLARAPRLPQNPATLISHMSACQPVT